MRKSDYSFSRYQLLYRYLGWQSLQVQNRKSCMYMTLNMCLVFPLGYGLKLFNARQKEGGWFFFLWKHLIRHKLTTAAEPQLLPHVLPFWWKKTPKANKRKGKKKKKKVHLNYISKLLTPTSSNLGY